MRFEGIIKSWNDDRGFGFIEPTQGGEELFVHVKAFGSRISGRPQPGQRVTFEVESTQDGRKQAKAVKAVRPLPASARGRPRSPAQWGTASLFAIPAFLVVYLIVAIVWAVPAWCAALYLGASLLCIVVYAVDKSASVAGRWRVSEGTLLALGLVGGWPGALIAQQVLRHKSSKASFRSAFWGTVLVNVAGFVALNSPIVLMLLG